ncbi:hypothetical protein [Streptomyces californicus]|uniref:hypothetical protein n=1 Tax=Streptomyces californicus TaxID=67351 RepID=UPI0033EBE0EB
MKTHLRRITTVGCLVLTAVAAAPTAQAQQADGGGPQPVPAAVETFSELTEDPEVVDHLFDALDKLSSQDKDSGELIKDVIVKPYGGKKRLASYIVKVSKEVYKQNPKGAKVLIDRLLEAH